MSVPKKMSNINKIYCSTFQRERERDTEKIEFGSNYKYRFKAKSAIVVAVAQHLESLGNYTATSIADFALNLNLNGSRRWSTERLMGLPPT